MNKILIYNENPTESNRLAEVLRSEDIKVVETTRVLEAIHILKNDHIDLLLASQDLTGMELEEFRELAESSSPGINIMFLGKFTGGGENITVSSEGLGNTIRSNIRNITGYQKKIADLQEFSIQFADRLLQTFEASDTYFFNNDHMVSDLASAIARRMELNNDLVSAIRMASLLKDIGKVGILNKLLNSDKQFSRDDFITMKKHPLNTVQILRQLNFPWDVESVIAQHHENYDGSGYHMGLKGRQICLGARIIHIADSYVAMTVQRPHKMPVSKEDAVKEIVKHAGSQYDPEIVEIFLSVIGEMPEPSSRLNLMLLERDNNLEPLVRLGVDSSRIEIRTSPSSLEAIRMARKKTPDLVIVDVSIFERATFSNFYKTMRELPEMKEKPFIFILPKESHPRQFTSHDIRYIVKPVDMDELVRAINSLLEGEIAQAIDKDEIKGLSGALEDFNLSDIIQILNLGVKTAKVEMVHGSKRGTIFVHLGKVVYAATGNLRGKDAFYELVPWEKGVFHILHGLESPDININMDTLHLLLASARAFDESHH